MIHRFAKLSVLDSSLPEEPLGRHLMRVPAQTRRQVMSNSSNPGHRCR